MIKKYSCIIYNPPPPQITSDILILKFDQSYFSLDDRHWMHYENVLLQLFTKYLIRDDYAVLDCAK